MKNITHKNILLAEITTLSCMYITLIATPAKAEIDILKVLNESPTKSDNITWSTGTEGEENTVQIGDKFYKYTWTEVDADRPLYTETVNNSTGDFKGDFIGLSTGIRLSNSSSLNSINANFIGNEVGIDIRIGGPNGNTAVYADFIGNGEAISSGYFPHIDAVSGNFIGNYNFAMYIKQGNSNEKRTLISDNRDILFYGNYIEDNSIKQYEAIFTRKGCSWSAPCDSNLIFEANNNGSFTFYDYINGEIDEEHNLGGIINFKGDGTGTFNLYNDIKGQKTVNLQADYVLNMLSPSDIHEGTSALSIISAKNITVSAAVKMAVDVDLNALEMDRFVADYFSVEDSGSIVVDQINVVADASSALGDTTTIPFVVLNTDDQGDPIGSASGLDLISTTVSEAVGSVYTYDVVYNETTGEFEFTASGLAPQPEPEPASDIGAALRNASARGMTQAVVEALSGKVLDHSPASALGLNSGDAQTLSTWVELFGSDDDVELKNVSASIDAQFYGIIGGVDSKRFTYDNGSSAVYALYAAYNGSRQKFDGQKIKQKGGYLGLSAALRKGAVFSSVTLNGGYLRNVAETSDGKDKFNTKVISLADKSGVDIRKGDWTFTPALSLGYMGIDTDDYTTKSGTRIENKFMNVFTAAPELKVAKDFGEGLDGYAKAAYRMFFYDNNKVKANDVLLPSMSVKPYVEYGLGLTKDWSQTEWNAHDVSSFAEITRHDGGREGWDINLGLKLDF